MTRNNKLSGPFLPVPRWVLPYISTDYVSHAVLNHFLQYLHPDTQELTTSYQHIASQMGCDRRTVMRSIKRLEEIGLIVKQQRVNDNNRNLTNRYYVNFNNPGVVSPESLVSPETPGVVSPESLGSVSSDTTSGVSSDTQSRVRNKRERNKKRNFSNVQVDRRLFDENPNG
jgi:DNA-binding Lrp family transcriptional regulator